MATEFMFIHMTSPINNTQIYMYTYILDVPSPAAWLWSNSPTWAIVYS